MTYRTSVRRWLFLGLITLALTITRGGGSAQAQTAPLGDDAADALSWIHLSTTTGDLPSPDIGTDQTSALVLDVDRNGVDDLVVASRRSSGASMVWYQRNDNGWTKYLVESQVLAIEAGGAFYDIDNDGDLDIVMGGDSASNQIWWWENPYPTYAANTPWTRRLIKNSGESKHHDQIFGDFDGDGKAELVFWNQRAKTLFLAEIPADPRVTQPWSIAPIYTWSSGEEREGLAAADIDNDGKVDIVGAGYWFKHNGGTSFTANAVDGSRHYTRSAAGQLIPGGRAELVFVPGDANGPIKFYHWNGSTWVGADLLGYDIIHGHTLELADFNNDGKLDIFNAEMRLDGGNPDAKARVFLGDAAGGFTETVVATGYGNHQSKVGDLDGDGDVDILGKPFNWDTPRLDIWINETVCTLSLDNWQRHVIDANRPWRAIFIDSADIDKDGDRDLITGGWWYKNPGAPGGTWTRNVIGTGLNNMAAVYDFDNDGDMDILGTGGQGADPNSTFVWAENDGSGAFTMRSNIAQADGTFLQGVAVNRFDAGNSLQVALSWHHSTQGNQLLTLPGDPINDTWTWKRLASFSQNEDLSAGDIGGSGKIDLLLGDYWQRNDGATWGEHELHTATDEPDRNELVDINDDGRLDAVVGFEPSGQTAPLAWYAQPADPTGTWTEHVIAQLVGPMSLDVQDMDNDGDPDIVVGEHNLANPAAARLIVYENKDGKGGSWQEHLVYTGDEHHDGARVADIDGDGDLDIFSIGWGHSNVILYENQAPSGCGPVVNPPRILEQPQDVSVIAGEPASFSVKAEGDAPLSYQWQRDGVNMPGGAIPTATNATLHLGSVTAADDGAQFRSVVTNAAGSATSAVATLTVKTKPIITEQPQDVNAISGSWALFSVKAEGAPPLAYQWQRDGTDIPNAIGLTYQMSDLKLGDDGARLTVSVSNSYGSVTSNEVVLHVNPPPSRPVSDDFNTCALDTTLWTFTDPVGDSSYATTSGEHLNIHVPAGISHDLWTGADDAPRMMQTAENGDMEIVAKFDSAVSKRFQIEGLLIEGADGDKIRADFRFDGSAVRIFAATFDNYVGAARIDNVITPPANGSMLLRLTRRGDEWTMAHSFDGAAWVMAAPFTFAMTVEKAGVFAGNAGDNPPEYTAVIDYFFNTSFPVSPEDGKPRDLPVNILGQGRVGKNPDKNSYTCSEAIILVASQDTGWTFDRWGGAASGSTSTVTVNYNISDTVTATFVEKAHYALNASTVGDGAVSKNPDQMTYLDGAEVVLTATPGSGWFFKEWQGDVPAGSANATLTLTVDREKSVEAVFEQSPPDEHSLTVNTEGDGAVGKNPDQGIYIEGTQVTLTATPNAGWVFKEWQGDVSAGSTDPTLVLDMGSDKVVKAVFGHNLIVETEGQGNVSKNPAQPVYLNGTPVTLTATPDIGWRFKEWQGDVPNGSTDAILVLTIDASKRVTGVFEMDTAKMFLPVVRQ